MTPHLLSLRAEGCARAARQRANEQMRSAWYTAALGRARDLPPLRELTVDVDTGAPVEDEASFVARMAAAFDAARPSQDDGETG